MYREEHHIAMLKELDMELEDDDRVWVYLKSFKDDDTLKGEYISNYGEMNELMKNAIGQTLDYGCYVQRIIEMNFAEFKEFYYKNKRDIELLAIQYPEVIF